MFDFLSLMSGEIKDHLFETVSERLVCPNDKLIIPISVIGQHENGTETSFRAYFDSKETRPFWSLATASGSATGLYNMLLYFDPTILKDKNEFRPSFAVISPPNWIRLRYLELDLAQYNALLKKISQIRPEKPGFFRYLRI